MRRVRVHLLAATLLVAGSALAGVNESDDTTASAWLGVVLADAVDGGVRVVAVAPGGPAERAGLRDGDLLIAVADAMATDRAAVGRALRSVAPGEAIPVRILREGRVVERVVDTSRRPPLPFEPAVGAAPGLGLSDRLGVRLVEISPELRRHYGAPPEAGVLVAAVDPGGLAARTGLEVGDVIVRVCGAPLTLTSAPDPCRVGGEGSAVLEIVRDRRESLLKADPARSYPRAPEPGAAAAGANEIRTRWIEEEIARLRRRLAELEEELARSK